MGHAYFQLRRDLADCASSVNAWHWHGTVNACQLTDIGAILYATARTRLFSSIKQTGVPVGGALAGFVLVPIAEYVSWQAALLLCGVAAWAAVRFGCNGSGTGLTTSEIITAGYQSVMSARPSVRRQRRQRYESSRLQAWRIPAFKLVSCTISSLILFQKWD